MSNSIEQVKSFIAACDEAARQLGMRVNAMSVAFEYDNNVDAVFTAFNPHFRKCECQDCKNTVAYIKAQVACVYAYGTPPNPTPI